MQPPAGRFSSHGRLIVCFRSCLFNSPCVLLLGCRAGDGFAEAMEEFAGEAQRKAAALEKDFAVVVGVTKNMYMYERRI